jgi:hypothetical protein
MNPCWALTKIGCQLTDMQQWILTTSWRALLRPELSEIDLKGWIPHDIFWSRTGEQVAHEKSCPV